MTQGGDGGPERERAEMTIDEQIKLVSRHTRRYSSRSADVGARDVGSCTHKQTNQLLQG